MTPPSQLPFLTGDRWREIEPLLDAALALTPTQRVAFLDQACDGDEQMRAELIAMAAECDKDAAALDAARARPDADGTPASFAALREALADRYDVQNEIGRGGMAIVLLAHDRKHQRDVAIKVLRADVGSAMGAERFQREIAIAARLSHPNILALHDSGEVAGLLFYVMPYVKGGTLRDRLRAEQQLALGECTRIALEMATALDYAHRQGVVHRDIKPENVLLQDGRVVIGDFGIARAMRHASGDPLTGASLSLGTPAYMSPEQATDSRHVDGRSDLYALGCVLYEMLTGQPPFNGPNAVSIITQHVAAPIPSARTLRAALSPTLDAVAQRAMAKIPADRFETGAALADALREAEAGGAAATPANSTHASIAVLPFTILSTDAENEYLSEGITEEIHNALTGIPGLRVASRRSAFAFKGQLVSISEVGQKLGVRTVLEGSFRRSQDRIRITAQLTNTADGYTLWSERYDRELEDVFAIQEEIARTIVETLRGRLTVAEEDRLVHRQTHDLAAYELYLRGRWCWDRRGMLTQSMSFFQRALEKDAHYALAHHGLADGYNVLALYAFAPPGSVVLQARHALVRAVELAPHSAEVRTSQGFLELLTWDWAAAERSLDLAIQLNPRYALAYSFIAWLYTTIGRERDADRAARRGQELDPLSPVTNGIAALVAYHARDYARSVAESQRALELEPTSFLARLAITLACAASGDFTMAVEHAAEGVRLSPDAVFLYALRGAVHGMAGHREEAAASLADLDRRARNGTYVAPVLRSWVHLHNGETELAFSSLEEAYTERSCPLGFGVRFPIYDGIRSDPRFGNLLARMNLA